MQRKMIPGILFTLSHETVEENEIYSKTKLCIYSLYKVYNLYWTIQFSVHAQDSCMMSRKVSYQYVRVYMLFTYLDVH